MADPFELANPLVAVLAAVAPGMRREIARIVAGRPGLSRRRRPRPRKLEKVGSPAR